MGRGIDYGRGMTNIDTATGIRYGVINLNALGEFAHESFEADYGPPTCGKCGSEADEYDDELHGEYKHGRGCADFACETCERVFGSDDAYGEEPHGWTLEDAEYSATMGQDDNDIFVLKSPYFTRAAFCSPCAPGACYLTSPDDDGERAYCFSPSWFPDDTAPYDVYSVKTGELLWKAGQKEG